MGDTLTLTRDELTKLVSDATVEAVKGLNTVAPEARPPAVVSNVNRQRYAMPRMGVAMKAMFDGGFRQSQEFERDLHQATREVFGYDRADDDKDPFIETFGAAKNSRSLFWPKTRQELSDVLWQMGEKGSAKSIDKVDWAIKAMSEGTGSAGGYLVPTQYLQDAFAYALVSTIALRQVPGVEILPVKSNVVALPRESGTAGASETTEAGLLSAQDATLSQQTITVKKQYGYRQYSNELLNDADPPWMEFLARTLVRDVALEQDKEYLTGSGSAGHIQGIVGYSGLTTTGMPSLGANGRTPTFDDLYDSQLALRNANAEVDFLISVPRVLNSLQKAKDSTGNYLLSNQGGYNAPRSFGTGIEGAPPKAVLIGSIGHYFSTQLSQTQTVGSSTDTTTAIFGTGRYIAILERQGIEVAFSEHVAFANDQTAARAIGRSAVAILQPTAVATLAGIRP